MVNSDTVSWWTSHSALASLRRHFPKFQVSNCNSRGILGHVSLFWVTYCIFVGDIQAPYCHARTYVYVGSEQRKLAIETSIEFYSGKTLQSGPSSHVIQFVNSTNVPVWRLAHVWFIKHTLPSGMWTCATSHVIQSFEYHMCCVRCVQLVRLSFRIKGGAYTCPRNCVLFKSISRSTLIRSLSATSPHARDRPCNGGSRLFGWEWRGGGGRFRAGLVIWGKCFDKMIFSEFLVWRDVGVKFERNTERIEMRIET